MRHASKRLPAVVFALVVGLVLAPVTPALAAANAVGKVDVTVVSYGGAPAIPNANVELVSIETAEVVGETVTDLEGTASFSELPAGLYQVRVITEGYTDAVSALLPITEGSPAASVTVQQEGEQCSCDPNDPAYDEDCECEEGSTVGVIGAAGGFTFLGLSGGGAVAALIGVAAGAVAIGYAVKEATDDDTP